MKGKILTVVFAAAAMAFILSACEKSSAPAAPERESMHSEHTKPVTEAKEVVYTCPMHPNVRMNQPGQCPICGMDLVVESPAAAPEKEKPMHEGMMHEGTTQEPMEGSGHEMMHGNTQ